MILTIVGAVLGMAFGLIVVCDVWRQARTPAELRGDWWSTFERQFRTYAAQGGPARPRRARDKPR